MFPFIYSTRQSPLFTTTRSHTASFFTALTKPVPATASFFPPVQIIPLWSCLILSTRQTYLRKLFPNHMNTINAPITVLVADYRQGMDSVGSKYRPLVNVAHSSEFGKGGESLEQLIDYQLLTKHCTARSLLHSAPLRSDVLPISRVCLREFP